ncbi:helix-turn-helix domain-containing protein [Campylobacter portucalensis]|nr:helix-turn-helix domain-containing protein [Campylobacter portucalensis]
MASETANDNAVVGGFSSFESVNFGGKSGMSFGAGRGGVKNVLSASVASETASDNAIAGDPKVLPLIARCSDKKRKEAFEKYDILQEWGHAKGKITINDFISRINAKKGLKLTANKLYDWQRKYKNGGLDGLVDERTNTKKRTLETLGLKEYAIKLINAQQGKINTANIYNLLNYEAIKSGKFSLEEFNGKKDEFVSYDVVNRFVKGYLKENKLLKNIILYGEDGAISRQMPAMGRSNWAVNSINQIVEIDASPLDLICNAGDICKSIGFEAVSDVFSDEDEFMSYIKQWQNATQSSL